MTTTSSGRGLRSVLESDPDFSVVAEACSGREALTLARRHHPDLVIMDVSMPDMDGIEATAAILAEFPEARILALSMHENREFMLKMLKAGRSWIRREDRRRERDFSRRQDGPGWQGLSESFP